MQKDIWKFGLFLAVAALFGFIAGHTVLAALIAALLIIGWQMYKLELLYKWIVNPKQHALTNSSGQFYLIHREINRRNTKNSRRKRQLSNYLSQFRKAASALPDAIVLIDDYGKIEWANKNADRIFGISWPKDNQVRFGDLIRDPEVEKLLKDDKDSNQDIDITSKKNLNHIVNIKIIRYTNDLRMVIARDVSRLVKINRMQSDFVANVSHELKTPLTVLKGYLEILQNNIKLPTKIRNPVEQMTIQSDRMQLIVQDLLYLAKLEDSNNKSNHEIVDVTHIVNTIIETIQEPAEQKRHKLELDIDYQLKIIGNATELHAAFSNLIFNAVHYTPEHGIINVRWQADDDGATFRVKDNGEGIASGHLPRLTQRFYRVDSDRSREGGGTGLGLAIVKHVMQRHNATLEIDSAVGIGSEFCCKFPRDQISVVTDTKTATDNTN